MSVSLLFRCVFRLCAVGDGLSAIALLGLLCWHALQRLAMMVEEPFYRRRKLHAPILILGAQRSATTALHESLALSAPADALLAGCTWIDVACPSRLLQLLLRPAFGIMHAYSRRFDTPGHRVAPQAWSEEHLLLPGSLAIWAVPPLAALLSSKEARLLHTITESDVRWIRRCMQRVCCDGQQYVGKPLGLTAYLPLLLRSFPDARFLICQREARDCLRSHITLAWNMQRKAIEKQPELLGAFANIIDQAIIGPAARAVQQWNESAQPLAGGMKKASAVCDAADVSAKLPAPAEGAAVLLTSPLLPCPHAIMPFASWVKDGSAVVRAVQQHFALPAAATVKLYKDAQSVPLPLHLLQSTAVQTVLEQCSAAATTAAAKDEFLSAPVSSTVHARTGQVSPLSSDSSLMTPSAIGCSKAEVDAPSAAPSPAWRLWLYRLMVAVRLPFHVNFAIVLCGFTMVHLSEYAHTAHASLSTITLMLLSVYFTFQLCLYTGIYAINALVDFETDQREKPWRTEACGRTTYALLAMGGISAGLMGASIIGLGHTDINIDTRTDSDANADTIDSRSSSHSAALVRAYMVFLMWNILYTLSKPLYGGNRWLSALLSGVTAPLRLCLGCFLACADVSRLVRYVWEHAPRFVALYFFMVAVHVRRKTESRQNQRDIKAVVPSSPPTCDTIGHRADESIVSLRQQLCIAVLMCVCGSALWEWSAAGHRDAVTLTYWAAALLLTTIYLADGCGNIHRRWL